MSTSIRLGAKLRRDAMNAGIQTGPPQSASAEKCQRCQRVFQPEDFPVAEFASCGGCGHITGIGGGSPTQKELLANPPAGFSIARRGVILKSVQHPAAVTLALLLAAAAGLIVWLAAVPWIKAVGGDATSLETRVIIWFFFGLGPLAVYAITAAALNVWQLSVQRGRLSFSFGPLPIGESKTASLETVREVWAGRDEVTGARKTGFAVWGRDRERQRRKLLGGLRSAPLAFWIASWLAYVVSHGDSPREVDAKPAPLPATVTIAGSGLDLQLKFRRPRWAAELSGTASFLAIVGFVVVLGHAKGIPPAVLKAIFAGGCFALYVGFFQLTGSTLVQVEGRTWLRSTVHPLWVGGARIRLSEIEALEPYEYFEGGRRGRGQLYGVQARMTADGRTVPVIRPIADRDTARSIADRLQRELMDGARSGHG